MKELAIILDKLGIDTSEVLGAVGTKWKLLKLKPGPLGGHCSKVVDVIHDLQSYGIDVNVTDLQAVSEEAMHEYGVRRQSWDEPPRADAVVAAAAYRSYAVLALEDFGKKVVRRGAFVDVKEAFDTAALGGADYRVWRF